MQQQILFCSFLLQVLACFRNAILLCFPSYTNCFLFLPCNMKNVPTAAYFLLYLRRTSSVMPKNRHYTNDYACLRMTYCMFYIVEFYQTPTPEYAKEKRREENRKRGNENIWKILFKNIHSFSHSLTFAYNTYVSAWNSNEHGRRTLLQNVATFLWSQPYG